MEIGKSLTVWLCSKKPTFSALLIAKVDEWNVSKQGCKNLCMPTGMTRVVE